MLRDGAERSRPPGCPCGSTCLPPGREAPVWSRACFPSRSAWLTVQPGDAGKGMQRALGRESAGMGAISGDLEQHQPSLGLSFPFCKLGVTGQQPAPDGGPPRGKGSSEGPGAWQGSSWSSREREEGKREGQEEKRR